MMASSKPEGVQSVIKAMDLLEALAEAGGELGLSDLAAEARMPLPTIHRLARTLVNRGFLRQLPNRHYALGPALIPLGDAATSMLAYWAEPILAGLVDELGETANLAILDGAKATYVAQVPSRHSMRMFTEVGRQVSLHSTGVGKALLSQLDDAAASALLGRTALDPRTEFTITDPQRLIEELATIRAQGFARDEGEQELGVNCIAVPVSGALMAVSISGPVQRLTDDLRRKAVPALTRAAAALQNQLSDRSA